MLNLVKIINMQFKLRPWKISDVESIVKYTDNKNITDFMSDAFSSLKIYENALAFIEKANSNPNLFYFAITIDDEAIGGIGISILSDIHSKNAEMGYWLAEPFWGRGIVTEAVKQMVSFGFKNCDILRIFARPFSNNIASHKVLLNAGFVQETKFVNTILKNGIILDEIIFSIRKTDINIV